YRLNVVQLEFPPLRERPGVIPLLAEHFLARFAEETAKRVSGMAPDCMARLVRYAWPGNVRELENVIERAVVLTRNAVLQPEDLPAELNGRAARAVPEVQVGTTLAEMEQALILRTLEAVDGNRTRAAEMLGISIRTIRNKLGQYQAEGVPVPAGRGAAA
ncbi:sigma-54-dependent Fis family transcriptional regulator, partial [bacterium]|nr:sigma-54-dependent Fis family transcriptional regulator [bacterium]